MSMSSGERTARGHLSRASSVADLNVPESQVAAKKAGRMFRELQADAKKTFPAYVLNADTGSSTLSKVQVLIDGTATSARLNTEVKAVKTGDTVRVRKSGGLWEVVGSETWRDPPKVGGTMGSKPSASGTTSTRSPSALGQVPSPPRTPYESPNSGPGSGSTQIYNWANNTFAYLNRVEQWQQSTRSRLINQRNYIDAMRSKINALSNNVDSLKSTVNTNASRLNQVRDYAGNAGDLVSPVVDALADERIVRK